MLASLLAPANLSTSRAEDGFVSTENLPVEAEASGEKKMSSTFVLHPGNTGSRTKKKGFDNGSGLGNLLSCLEIVRLPLTNFIPDRGVEFRRAAYITIPAIGAQAIVAQYKVPDGSNGILNALANVFVGGGFTEGQGSIVWQLFQDFTPGGGVVAADFDTIVASLGSVNNPAKLNGIRIKENQLVTLLVKNVSVVVAGQLIGGLLGGYSYPIDLEPSVAF